MQHEFTVQRVPQCDPLGYESESYEIVMVEADGAAFTFPNVVLAYERDGNGNVTKILVGQNMNDHELRDSDKAELFGSISLDGCASETFQDFALGSWLLTSPEGQDMFCEVY